MFRQAKVQQNQLRVTRPSGQGVERPKVLFVCVHNAGRSRMAAAFLNEMAGDRYAGISAGTSPADHPHPEVVAAMAEIGIEIENIPGTMLTNEMAEEALKLVSMGCNVEEACPALRIPMEDWALEDPKGQPPEKVAEIRDSIEIRVRNLVAKLDREMAEQH
ncbi:MAG: low molecular weight phosphatase family protein [Actinomycetota bacterium]